MFHNFHNIMDIMKGSLRKAIPTIIKILTESRARRKIKKISKKIQYLGVSRLSIQEYDYSLGSTRQPEVVDGMYFCLSSTPLKYFRLIG